MHPVGPLNSTVYWIRRVSIVVFAVALLIGMVWFLASRTSRSSAGQDPAVAAVNTSATPTLTGVLAASSGPSRSTIASVSPSPSPASPSPSPSPSASASASASAPGASPSAAASVPTSPAAPVTTVTATTVTSTVTSTAAAAAAAAPSADATPTTDPAAPAATAGPAPTPEPPPSYDAQGKLVCPDAAIGVTAISAAPSFAIGSQPTLGMVVTNAGAQACQRDVSGTLQTFTVFAADGTRVWSTSDCFPGEGTEVRELTPGQTLKYTIKWSGTASSPGCTGDRAPLPAGDYTVVAQLGGLASAPVAFAITG